MTATLLALLSMFLPVFGDGPGLRLSLPPIPTRGLAFAFDAAKGVTLSGSNVTALADQSGNGNNLVAMSTQPTFSANLVNGNPGITGTGLSNQGMNNTSVLLTSNNSPRTMIAVTVPAVTDSSGMVFDWRGGFDDFYQAMGLGGTLFMYGNNVSNSIASAGGATGGVVHVSEYYSDGTTISFALDSVYMSLGGNSAAGGDNGAAGFSFMSRFNGTNSFNGSVLWCYGWSDVLTAAERGAVLANLQARFGVTLLSQLTLSADSLTVAPNASKTFIGGGGSAGYVFSLVTNNSGGNINSSSGVYTAGSTPGVVDVIKVTDQSGASVTRNISVTSTTTTTHITSGKRVLMVGDSTASAAGGNSWWSTTFSTDVNTALSPGSATFIDGGHPGTFIQDIVTNFSSWVTANTPDIVYVISGVNNVGQNTSPSAFASSVSTIISNILTTTSATKIAFTSICCDGEIWSTGPVWGVNGTPVDVVDPLIDQYNSITESIINGLRNPNVIYINFRKQLLQQEPTINPSKSVSGGATLDGIHPNATGKSLESGFAFAQVTAP